MPFLAKTAVAIIAVVGVAAVVSESPPEGTETQVIRVIDGDTIETEKGRVRLIGIDAPELDKCGGPEARDHLSTLLEGSRVGLERDYRTDELDKFKRSLFHVNVSSGTVGDDMIADGHAIARYDSQDGYPKHRHEDTYRAIEGVAAATDCGQRDHDNLTIDDDEYGDADEWNECRGLDVKAAVACWDGVDRSGYDSDIEGNEREARGKRYEAARSEWEANLPIPPRQDAADEYSYDEFRKNDWRTVYEWYYEDEGRLHESARDDYFYEQGAAEREREWQRLMDEATSGSSSGGGGGDGGYTGPRCYAPGGETWTPC